MRITGRFLVVVLTGMMAMSFPRQASAARSGKSWASQAGTGNVIARFAPSEKIKLGPENVTVRIPLSDTANKAILQAAKDEAGGNRICLKVTGIEYQQNPGAGYEIYLNLPAGQVPDQKNIYYAGVLHFFGLKQTAEATGTPAASEFDVSETVRRLQQSNQWSDNQLSVTFVRRGPLSPSGEATTTVAPEAVPSFAELDIVVE